MAQATFAEVETNTRNLKIELWFNMEMFCEICGNVTDRSATFTVQGKETEICPDCLKRIVERLEVGS